jgi:hypothetical protein
MRRAMLQMHAEKWGHGICNKIHESRLAKADEPQLASTTRQKYYNEDENNRTRYYHTSSIYLLVQGQ